MLKPIKSIIPHARVSRDGPEPPRTRRKAAVAAQQERLRTLNAQGYVTIRGKTGATVFRLGDECYSV